MSYIKNIAISVMGAIITVFLVALVVLSLPRQKIEVEHEQGLMTTRTVYKIKSGSTFSEERQVAEIISRETKIPRWLGGGTILKVTAVAMDDTISLASRDCKDKNEAARALYDNGYINKTTFNELSSL